MASDNTRDVTPDDFGPEGVPSYDSYESYRSYDSYDSDGDAYEYTNEARTESFPSARSSAEHTEQFLRSDPAAQTEYISEVSYEAPEPVVSHETAAIDREPVYIAPAEPVYEETAIASEPVVAAEPVVTEVGRGTIDLGLLLLRVLFGAYLVLSSLTTFFRLGNSDGINGLENAFSNYPFGDGLAILVPTLELAAGVFLILGLIAPAAAAVAVAVTGFMALHSTTSSGLGWNPLYWDATVWLPIMLLVIALAIQFTGPGLYSIDAGRSWARRPLVSSWIWLVVGVAAAVALWWLGTAMNPFTSGTLPTPVS